MPRKANLLNVRKHLEHAELIAQGFAKYGMCPAIADELRKFLLINRAILRSHSRKHTRKDLYVEARHDQT